MAVKMMNAIIPTPENVSHISLKTPAQAQAMGVHAHGEADLQIFLLGEDTAPIVTTEFLLLRTGQPFPDNLPFSAGIFPVGQASTRKNPDDYYHLFHIITQPKIALPGTPQFPPGLRPNHS